MDRILQQARKRGEARAREVFAARMAALDRRAGAIRKATARSRAHPVTPSRPRAPGGAARQRVLTRVGDASPLGTLVAEGDSWFDYPGTDILSALAEDHGYDIDTVAHRGDRLEQMAYDTPQLERLGSALEQLMRRQATVRAILLSGGGNDVAGDAFEFLLDHHESLNRKLNARIVEGVIFDRLRPALAHIIAGTTAIATQYLGRPLPVIVHGYAYPVSDGRGFWGGWGPLPGPWLEPGFRRKGYGEKQLAQRMAITRPLIDRFNVMVQEVAAAPGFEQVRYVDLRSVFTTDLASYKTWWANELHPTRKGYRAAADAIAKALRGE